MKSPKTVALVSGLGIGIGQAIAVKLRELGWTVVSIRKPNVDIIHGDFNEYFFDLSETSGIDELV